MLVDIYQAPFSCLTILNLEKWLVIIRDRQNVLIQVVSKDLHSCTGGCNPKTHVRITWVGGVGIIDRLERRGSVCTNFLSDSPQDGIIVGEEGRDAVRDGLEVWWQAKSVGEVLLAGQF